MALDPTISLIVHATKVLLKIIKGRIKLHYDREMAEEQAGVMERKGTKEQIVDIRISIEKCRNQNIPLTRVSLILRRHNQLNHMTVWAI